MSHCPFRPIPVASGISYDHLRPLPLLCITTDACELVYPLPISSSFFSPPKQPAWSSKMLLWSHRFRKLCGQLCSLQNPCSLTKASPIPYDFFRCFPVCRWTVFSRDLQGWREMIRCTEGSKVQPQSQLCQNPLTIMITLRITPTSPSILWYLEIWNVILHVNVLSLSFTFTCHCLFTIFERCGFLSTICVPLFYLFWAWSRI